MGPNQGAWPLWLSLPEDVRTSPKMVCFLGKGGMLALRTRSSPAFLSQPPWHLTGLSGFFLLVDSIWI